MLNKEICKRCINNSMDKWDKQLDRLWNQGRVVCPSGYRDEVNIFHLITKLNKRCIFNLEHIMEDQ